MKKYFVMSCLIFSSLSYCSKKTKLFLPAKPHVPSSNEMREALSEFSITYEMFKHHYQCHTKNKESCLDRCVFEITAPCMALCCPWIREELCQGNCNHLKKD